MIEDTWGNLVDWADIKTTLRWLSLPNGHLFLLVLSRKGLSSTYNIYIISPKGLATQGPEIHSELDNAKDFCLANVNDTTIMVISSDMFFFYGHNQNIMEKEKVEEFKGVRFKGCLNLQGSRRPIGYVTHSGSFYFNNRNYSQTEDLSFNNPMMYEIKSGDKIVEIECVDQDDGKWYSCRTEW